MVSHIEERYDIVLSSLTVSKTTQGWWYDLFEAIIDNKSSEEFKREQVAKSGDQHFQQNFGNEFLGSSATLVAGSALKNITPVKDEEIIFNNIFSGLRQFEEPKKGNVCEWIHGINCMDTHPLMPTR